MTERDRVLVSAVGAVGIHVALFFGLNTVDWGALSQNQPSPVYVQLEEIVAASVPDEEGDPGEEPESESEPAEQEQPQQPEQPPESSQEPDPATPEPTPQPAEPEDRPQAAAPQENAPESPPASGQGSQGTQDSGSDAGQDDWSEPRPEDLDTSARALQGDDTGSTGDSAFSTSPGSSGSQGSQSGPRVAQSEAPEVELPEWVRNPSTNTESSTQQMSAEEERVLARRIEADPEFRDRLRSALSGLEQQNAAADREGTSGDSSGTGPGTSDDTGDSSADGSGERDGQSQTPGNRANAALQWASAGGDRGTPGRLPQFTPADFGGRVPAETTFVVIFEVDRTGTIVPGSIIFQQQSVHPRVNEKLRSAIRQWTFAEKPQAERESAIFSLSILRNDVEQTN